MPLFTIEDFADEFRFNRKCETIVCPKCRERGVNLVAPALEGLLIALCDHCGEPIENVGPFDLSILPTLKQGHYMKGDHRQFSSHLFAALASSFEIVEQVYLRHPITYADPRIDAVAIPRDPGLAERFPFDCIGIEIKPEPQSFAHLTHALKQCHDYRNCTINDKRLPWLRSRPLLCVALYQGRMVDDRNEPPRYDAGTLMRYVGLWNIGEFVHDKHQELSLLVSYERLWSKKYGVPDGKTSWPTVRRLGNSRRRG